MLIALSLFSFFRGTSSQELHTVVYSNWDASALGRSRLVCANIALAQHGVIDYLLRIFWYMLCIFTEYDAVLYSISGWCFWYCT